MKGLMLALAVWIHAHIGLPLPAKMPEIRSTSGDQLCRLMGGGENYCEPGVYEVLALYANGTILVRKDWTPNEQIGVSILLHEMVHHMQREKDYPCRGAMEKEAYEAQRQYLREAGINDPNKAMKINDLWLYTITACGLE